MILRGDPSIIRAIRTTTAAAVEARKHGAREVCYALAIAVQDLALLYFNRNSVIGITSDFLLVEALAKRAMRQARQS